MKKSVVFILFAFISTLFTCQAQPEEPVKWNFSVVKINDSIAELQLKATIQDKWHLYAMSHNNGIENPIEFSFTPNPNYELTGKTTEPKPIEHFDDFFNDYSHYFEKNVTFKQRIRVKNAEPFEIKGTLSGQACIDGRCVAIDRKIKFNVSGFENVAFTNVIDENPQPEENDVQETQNDSKTVVDLTHRTSTAPEEEKEQSLWLFFLTAIGGGLIGLLMPCVFPMIPMTVSFFMKSKRPKFDASVYGISIVIIFVIVGIILSLIFGPDFANVLSTHWIPNILFALIFVFFAISLLGYFEIALPSKWVNKSAKMESRGGVLGIFFMALTLVLVSFSCTLPIAGAVALSSADGNFLKPIIGMLGFSLGIAVPFTFFAFFPNLLKKMPKSGGWMNTLKVSLAFVELAFALKFLNVPDQTYHWGILDREVYLALWVVIFGMLGFYLLGKIKFPHDDDMPYQKSWIRYFLSIGVFAFVVYLIPGLFGAPLKSISGWLPPMTTQDFDINHIVRSEMGAFEGSSSTKKTCTLTETPKYGEKLHLPYNIHGYFDYDQALSVAKKENKPLFIDFTGHGCVNCRKVEAAVWVDAKVRKKLKEDFVVAALYVDDKTVMLQKEDQLVDDDGDAITMLGKKNMYIQNKKYGENSQPCYFIVNHDGMVLAGPTHFEMSVDNYLKFLDTGLEAFRKKHP
jgi:thiol:disulfide interchange protein DsbD